MWVGDFRVEDWQVAGSAAGTLQNLSRQTACRVLIKDEGAVQPLVRLLCGPALQVVNPRLLSDVM